MHSSENEIRSYTNVDGRPVGELVEALQGHQNKKERIIIPKYQRNLVWLPEQKELFIKSLKSGFPVGSILLFNSGSDSDGILQYVLVDGLQRCSTLMQYMEYPTQFFDRDEISDDFLKWAVHFAQVVIFVTIQLYLAFRLRCLDTLLA